MTHPGGNPEQHRAEAQAKPRDHRGVFIPSLETAERNAEACRLKTKGWSYRRIAKHFGIDVHTAFDAVQDALVRTMKEPADNLRTLMLDRLDEELVRLEELEEAARKVLTAKHIMVNNGHVILQPGTDQPMEDDGPVLQAIDRLVKIEESRRRNGERRAKLTGIEAAVKTDITVHEVTQQDLELQEMLRDAQARMDAQEKALRERGPDSGA